MDEPLVSVILSFFNCEHTLLDAVRSILAQTFENWELILLDGGSTDNSFDIANSILDPRVRVICDGLYYTHPAALNYLIELARGKYIARMDGDDFCAPSRLEKQLGALMNDDSIEVIGTGVVYLDENDVPVGQAIHPATHSEICKQPYRTFFLCHGSVMAKREWYLRNKYDETAVKVEDFDLWLRSHEHSKFANITEPLYFYKCETSFSQKKLLVSRMNSIRIVFRYYKKKNIFKAVLYSMLLLFKTIVGLAVCLVKSERSLLQRRYIPISTGQECKYVDELKYVKSIHVPIKDERKP